MKAENLRKLLEKTNDRLKLLSSKRVLKRYSSSSRELVRLIDMYLNDEEKKAILNNQELIDNYRFNEDDLYILISFLGDEKKAEVLTNRELIEDKFHLSRAGFITLAKGLQNEEAKVKLLDIYDLDNTQMTIIANTLGIDNKLKVIASRKDFFKKIQKITMLSLLSDDELTALLESNKEFLAENDIHPYELINGLDNERQKVFAGKIVDINLTLDEKREILAILQEEVKESIDTTNFPEEYKTAITMKTNDNNSNKRIVLDLDRNLENYRGLDNLIKVNPEEFTQEQRNRFMQLCDICPNLQVINTLDNTFTEFVSSSNEYKEAETWISSIIDNLNPKYSKAQKLAVIDNAIGNKISYSPDFDTEVFNVIDSRALWKIISFGYGVCNGIAKVEQYMLKRAGIESEFINSANHAFLKIKDIELPNENGKFVKGNTVVDVTWNLTANRFGAMPDCFCKSYEEIRKRDINKAGEDCQCHKNDEALQDATLNLNEINLRLLYRSVGLTNEQGEFPLKSLVGISKAIDTVFEKQPERNVSNQFLLLQRFFPEFATYPNSSMSVLKDVLLNNENLKFDKCVINRVYNRQDKGKRPVLYVYMDSDELGKKFYFADKDSRQFVEIAQEEFVKQFECYRMDLEKNNRN